MFKNIAEKVKNLAMAITCVGIVASILVGIAFIVNANRSEDSIGIGWLIIIVGPFVSWISSLPLYAIGKSAENSAKACEEQERANRKLDKILELLKHSPESQMPKKAVEFLIESSPLSGECQSCHRANLPLHPCTIASDTNERKELNLCEDCIEKMLSDAKP